MTTIEDLKDEVSISEVLAHYGAQVGRSGSWTEWRPVNCPFCRDRNGSGSVNMLAGRFLCHQCGAPRDGQSGDIVDVVKYGEDITDTREAIRWIERTFT